ncbi:MAG: hypothetical protein MAG581_01974 [Deltaproteobacteria bacterium]|jgi:uncharacterized protein YdeI (YjbR/CyaY-like superfamily)|nr:hypothetical protein [Deltaproteobacteria bacterium]
MERHKTADDYFSSNNEWKKALTKLRKILLRTELQETVKWGMPTYTLDGKNVAGLAGFKSYFGIWFFNGVFLKDEQGILISAQDGKTKSLRQWRFYSIDDIEEKLIINYIDEAINVQKEGKKIKPEKNRSLNIPDKLMAEIKADKQLIKCFQQLSMSKQREYADYIAEAKREETKTKRIEKIKPMILKNIGLNDKYK